VTTCFVIGPIGNELADLGTPERDAWESSLEIYESVIRAACQFLDIEAVRADQIAITGDITEQVFRRLYEADLVIADISGANANVMYELGLRHSINALTIPVADVDTPLPFDVKVVRTIMIKRSQFGLVDARKKLVKAIEEGLDQRFDMAPATRIWQALGSSEGSDVSVYLGDDGPPAELLDADDADGYFEIMMSLEQSFADVTTSIGEIAECLVEMNEETTSASEDMAAAGPTTSAQARLTLMRKFADIFRARATRFDLLTEKYQQDLHALDAKVSPLLTLMAGHESIRNQEGSDTFLIQIETLAGSARDAFEGLTRFTASVQQLGVLSNLLRGPAKTIVKSVGRMAETVGLLDDWEAAAIKIRESA
jgi:hypothetical protein